MSHPGFICLHPARSFYLVVARCPLNPVNYLFPQAAEDNVASICMPLAALLCFPETAAEAGLMASDSDSDAGGDVLAEAALALLAESVARGVRAFVKGKVRTIHVTHDIMMAQFDRRTSLCHWCWDDATGAIMTPVFV